MKSLPLFRYSLPTRRIRRVLLLVWQGDALHAFSARGDVLSPLPPLSESALPPAENVDAIRLCLSASNVFFRVWTFPFRSRAKIRQALQLLMPSELPFDPGTLEHALLFQHSGKKDTVVLSASIHKARLAAILETLRGYGIEPDSITADPFPFIGCLSSGRQEREERHVHCLLRENHTLLLYMNGLIVQGVQILQTGWRELYSDSTMDTARLDSITATVRTDGFRTALEREGLTFTIPQANRLFTELHEEAVRLFQQYAQDETPEISLHCELFADARTASLFSETRCAEAFTQGGIRLSLPIAEPQAALLQCKKIPAEFPNPKERRSGSFMSTAWQWKIGIACALVLGGALLSLLAEGAFLARRTTTLETETVSVFQRALPELGGRKFGVVQMESILRQRVQALAPESSAEGASVVQLLNAVHKALDTSFPVRFTTFRLARNVASLSGTTDGYETVNRIRDKLAGLPEIASVRLVNAGATAGSRAGNPQRPGANDTRDIVFELEIVVK